MYPMDPPKNDDFTITADPGMDIEEYQDQFCEKIGIPKSVPRAKAIEQIIGKFLPVTPEHGETINWLLTQVASHKPKSLLEAQLIVQMIACHELCMRMLCKAGQEKWPENVDRYANIAMKLSRCFKNGIEALSKFRRDGKQYLYIERINVEKDGQAVIGNVKGGD